MVGGVWWFTGLGPFRLWRLAHWIGGRRRALWRSKNETISNIWDSHDEYGLLLRKKLCINILCFHWAKEFSLHFITIINKSNANCTTWACRQYNIASTTKDSPLQAATIACNSIKFQFSLCECSCQCLHPHWTFLKTHYWGLSFIYVKIQHYITLNSVCTLQNFFFRHLNMIYPDLARECCWNRSNKS